MPNVGLELLINATLEIRFVWAGDPLWDAVTQDSLPYLTDVISKEAISSPFSINGDNMINGYIDKFYFLQPILNLLWMPYELWLVFGSLLSS